MESELIIATNYTLSHKLTHSFFNQQWGIGIKTTSCKCVALELGFKLVIGAGTQTVVSY